ncbi:hypothetical protein CSB37_03790 [bacterium DOLZORAL124_38_8]|nr:MAG: hypothetical protein CSB37_03790 [bacterium DOLZORAL124_38_8]
MAEIITFEQYKGRCKRLIESYQLLKKKFPEDVKFKKMNRVFRLMRSLYGRDKIYAVNHLNYLEHHQVYFDEERRALIVQGIELLKKLILHKKLNKPVESPIRKKKLDIKTLIRKSKNKTK